MHLKINQMREVLDRNRRSVIHLCLVIYYLARILKKSAKWGSLWSKFLLGLC